MGHLLAHCKETTEPRRMKSKEISQRRMKEKINLFLFVPQWRKETQHTYRKIVAEKVEQLSILVNQVIVASLMSAGATESVRSIGSANTN